MKTRSILGTIAIATLLAGCCLSHPKGSVYGHEQEFRQKIEASIPVQKWGYKVEEIRFTDDREKALVVFDTPEDNRQEVVFKDDGFHRYSAQVWDVTRRDKKSGGLPLDASQNVTITFPSR
jgi:hypothetical protein